MEMSDLVIAHVESLIATVAEQQARIKALEAALREIARGEGRYSLDQYEHACNTIENLKAIARAALDKDAGIGCGKSVIEPWSAALDKDAGE